MVENVNTGEQEKRNEKWKVRKKNKWGGVFGGFYFQTLLYYLFILFYFIFFLCSLNLFYLNKTVRFKYNNRTLFELFFFHFIYKNYLEFCARHSTL
jgi:mannosyltransferase OCH1-like enzyme